MSYWKWQIQAKKGLKPTRKQGISHFGGQKRGFSAIMQNTLEITAALNHF